MKWMGMRTDAFAQDSGKDIRVKQEAFRAANAPAFQAGAAPIAQSGEVCRSGVFRSARTGSEQAVRKIISTRSQRSKFLPDHLFADPAWDMLLDLYLNDILSKRISVSNLCRASNVPATTALRWISTLQREGLVERTSDPIDHRRYFVTLSPRGLAAMDGFFSSDAARSLH